MVPLPGLPGEGGVGDFEEAVGVLWVLLLMTEL